MCETLGFFEKKWYLAINEGNNVDEAICSSIKFADSISQAYKAKMYSEKVGEITPTPPMNTSIIINQNMDNWELVIAKTAFNCLAFLKGKTLC